MSSERGERDPVTVALSPASGASEKDPEDLGPDPRPTFEAVEPPQHTEPRLLDDVGRCLGTSHEEAGVLHYRTFMAPRPFYGRAPLPVR